MMLALLVVFVAVLTIAPAHAQSRQLKANVPFAFSVGKTSLQAGNYRVGTEGAFVSFSKQGQGANAIYALLYPGSRASDHDGQPYLVFYRYGTESFLNKIVFSSNDVYELPRSNREKELMAHTTSPEQVAVLIQPLR